jgi:hypothetical protein
VSDARFQRFADWLRDVPHVALLRLLDLVLGLEPPTLADRIREERRERLWRLFPGVDMDGSGSKWGR